MSIFTNNHGDGMSIMTLTRHDLRFFDGDRVMATVDEDTEMVAINVSRMPILTSLELVGLVVMRRRLEERGISMALIGVGPDLMRVIEIVHLHECIDIYDDVQTAETAWQLKKLHVSAS